jgi:hypothetical protein
MSKYDVLASFLKSRSMPSVPMTFFEVEKVLGFKLPASAFAYPAWWSNEPMGHVQARAWMDAGFETEAVDIASKRVVFRRVFAPKGMQEARMFEYKNESVARHPALGAMKGSFTIEPGYDLAQSPFSAQELAEIDGNLDRTADLIEAGMKKKS